MPYYKGIHKELRGCENLFYECEVTTNDKCCGGQEN